MAPLYSDLENAVVEALTAASDQGSEFKRRFRRLIENATAGNLVDADVREVVELASVEDTEEN